MTEERTFLRDSEWASIDGDLCLVTKFVPLAGRIENGSVVAFDTGTPYASVQLKSASYIPVRSLKPFAGKLAEGAASKSKRATVTGNSTMFSNWLRTAQRPAN
jgi:hypothetical protein